MDKATLYKYRALEDELDQLGELIARIEARIKEPKIQKLSHAPAGGGAAADAISANIARLDVLRVMYNEKWGTIIAKKIEIEKAIDNLEPDDRLLMRYRYIEGLSWEDVADKLGYCKRHVTRRHGEILVKMQNDQTCP